MQNWRSLMKEFLLQKKADGCAPRTIQDYKFHITRFFQAHPRALSSPSALLKACLNYFADSNNDSPYYFNTKRKCLRAFFGYLKNDKKAIADNPIDRIRHRKEDETPKAVGENILEELLKLPDKKTFAGLRDYTLIMLTLDTGIRPKEAFGLLPGDIDLEDCKIEISARIAKDREARTLPILPQTALAIHELLQARHPDWPDTVPVFCTEEGRPMSRHHWARRMHQYTEQLGAKVTPYQLRHSFATLYLRNGGNAFALKETLGHSTMEMTRRYVKLVEKDLKTVHATASPLNRLMPKKQRIRKIPRR